MTKKEIDQLEKDAITLIEIYGRMQLLEDKYEDKDGCLETINNLIDLKFYLRSAYDRICYIKN